MHVTKHVESLTNRYRCPDCLTFVKRFTRLYVFAFTSVRVYVFVHTCLPSRPYVFAVSSLRVYVFVFTCSVKRGNVVPDHLL